ncbi:MAG: hypothetical protein ACOYON_16470, partial [Fimbriimonas sp.]
MICYLFLDFPMLYGKVAAELASNVVRTGTQMFKSNLMKLSASSFALWRMHCPSGCRTWSLTAPLQLHADGDPD